MILLTELQDAVNRPGYRFAVDGGRLGTLRYDALDVAFEGQAAGLGFLGEAGFEFGLEFEVDILVSG